jgi:hypothetical protein
MGRGPGKWQRIILDRLERGEPFYLLEVLDYGYTKAEYNALNRAARELEKRGEIRIERYMSVPRGEEKLGHAIVVPKEYDFDRLSFDFRRRGYVLDNGKWVPDTNTYTGAEEE